MCFAGVKQGMTRVLGPETNDLKHQWSTGGESSAKQSFQRDVCGRTMADARKMEWR